jgi:glycolate oxidase FAD binding subunit
MIERRSGPSGPTEIPDTPATVADAIDGVVPRAIVEPGSGEEVAAVLAEASRTKTTVVVRGGGTKMGWGRPPSSIGVLLSTKGLDRLVAHEHHDLTATMQAGARIDLVNAQLAHHGQWLPIESAFDAATIGGAIATNDSGPLRHRYGTPRDLLIGIRLALPDGRLIKSGGNVVKNVAGYDLGKLISGSFGSLAAIVSATFKLVPLPAASSTMTARFDDVTGMTRALEALGASQLEPAACDVHVRLGSEVPSRERCRLLLKFESTPKALNAHLEATRALMGGAQVEAVDDTAGDTIWRPHLRALWAAPGIMVKAGWLPASLGRVVAFMEEARIEGADVELQGRAAVGSGLLRVDGDLATKLRVVERMRARTDLFHHVVVLRAEAEVKRQVDVWGSLGDAAAVGAAVKRALDEQGILNAGRGPV